MGIREARGNPEKNVKLKTVRTAEGEHIESQGHLCGCESSWRKLRWAVVYHVMEMWRREGSLDI
jgi:hypothetical protein